MLDLTMNGNVITVLKNNLPMFDIEYSYAVTTDQRKLASRLLREMIVAHNAETMNAQNPKLLKF